jgi:carbonic anhydrase
VQFHFHAPSEHLVNGKTFPMEVHFVQRPRAVRWAYLACFSNRAHLMQASRGLPRLFQAKQGETAAAKDVDPRGLLPKKAKVLDL